MLYELCLMEILWRKFVQGTKENDRVMIVENVLDASV